MKQRYNKKSKTREAVTDISVAALKDQVLHEVAEKSTSLTQMRSK